MIAMLERNLAFIEWANFADARVWFIWLGHLMLSMLLTAGFLLPGTLFLRGATELPRKTRLVMTWMTGTALVSVLMTVLGLVGGLRPVFMVAGYLLLLTGLSLWAKSNLREFFVRPVQDLIGFFKEEKWVCALFLLSSFPSLYPPYRYDEMSYHLPYVRQWVEQGALTVDAAMRYPLNSFSFHMLQVPAYMIGSATAVHFLSWVFGCFACVAVLAFLESLKVWKPVGYAAALGFFLSPLIQRHLNVGMVDVAATFYFVAFGYALFLCKTYPNSHRLYTAMALGGGMMAALRMVNIVLTPVILLLAKPGKTIKVWMSFCLVFVCVAGIWPLRNFVVAGDPVPPFGSIAMQRTDKFWSRQDIVDIQENLNAGLSWDVRALLSLPLELYRSRENGRLRDWPFQGFILLAPLALIFFKKKLANVFIFFWAGALLWAFGPHLARYAHFSALAAVMAGIFVVRFMETVRLNLKSNPVRLLYGFLALVVLLGPNLNAVRYYKNNFSRPVVIDENSRVRFFNQMQMPEALWPAQLPVWGVPPGTVYVLGLAHFKYYFNQAGYDVVGDGVNRFRWSDCAESIRTGQLYDFLKDVGASAALIYEPNLEPAGLSRDEVLNRVGLDPRLSLWTEQPGLILVKVLP